METSQSRSDYWLKGIIWSYVIVEIKMYTKFKKRKQTFMRLIVNLKNVWFAKNSLLNYFKEATKLTLKM